MNDKPTNAYDVRVSVIDVLAAAAGPR